MTHTHISPSVVFSAHYKTGSTIPKFTDLFRVVVEVSLAMVVPLYRWMVHKGTSY